MTVCGRGSFVNFVRYPACKDNSPKIKCLFPFPCLSDSGIERWNFALSIAGQYWEILHIAKKAFAFSVAARFKSTQMGWNDIWGAAVILITNAICAMESILSNFRFNIYFVIVQHCCCTKSVLQLKAVGRNGTVARTTVCELRFDFFYSIIIDVVNRSVIQASSQSKYPNRVLGLFVSLV